MEISKEGAPSGRLVVDHAGALSARPEPLGEGDVRGVRRVGVEARAVVEAGEQGHVPGALGAHHVDAGLQVPELRDLIAQGEDAVAHLGGAAGGVVNELEEHHMGQHGAGAYRPARVGVGSASHADRGSGLPPRGVS